MKVLGPYLIQIECMMKEDLSDGTVRIATQGEVPTAAMMMTIEHLMNMFAGESEAGYERALELLCEGARKSKRRLT